MTQVYRLFTVLLLTGLAAFAISGDAEAGCRPHNHRSHLARHVPRPIPQYAVAQPPVETVAPVEPLLPCEDEFIYGYHQQQQAVYAYPYQQAPQAYAFKQPVPSAEICFNYQYGMQEGELFVRPLRAVFRHDMAPDTQLLQYGVQVLAFRVVAQPYGRICLSQELMAQYGITDVLVCDKLHAKGNLGPGNLRTALSGGVVRQVIPIGDPRHFAG